MIPDFDNNNTLPPGIHTATWQEFCDRYGYTKHRRELLAGLEKGMNHLREANCSCVWIDGSFISAKHRPGDFDVCWDEDGVNMSFLKTMYPALLDFSNERKRQKGIYRGEFFLSTELEAYKPKRTFLEFFQQDDRERIKKGIIKIML